MEHAWVKMGSEGGGGKGGEKNARFVGRYV